MDRPPPIDRVAGLAKIEAMSDSQPVRPVPQRGAAFIRAQLEGLPNAPGVYRFSDGAGALLYVGKAKSLRRRVAAYTRPERLPVRIQRMVAAAAALEVTTTHTEVEALLLESNLIKRLKPRYNVLLRDDKSFPYILVTGGDAWPRITKHRGARSLPGEYFGPFASAGAVNQTLAVLERAFPLRSCTDTVFAGRTRPCLQHQIKRCSAPCAGKITPEAYGAIVDEARAFLSGRSREIQARLVERMQAASDGREFEIAAQYRDRIRALAQIQAHQTVNVEGLGEADVFAAHREADATCVQVFFFRAGQNFGNRPYFPRHADADPTPAVLAAFIGQFYVNKPVPPEIIVSHALPNQALIEAALSFHAKHRVRVRAPQRGARRQLIDQALGNARTALARRLAESASQRSLLKGVAAVFGLDVPPARIEIYDNSHLHGTHAAGVMVVAGPDGFMKNAYRKFTIRNEAAPGNGRAAAPQDDYAMMREVITRRFARALKDDPDRSGSLWPDLLLIDGGLGHINAVHAVLEELGIDDIAVVGIAKGPARDAGREHFTMRGRGLFTLPPNDPVLYYVERLRDEAHRFAIGTHRAKRADAIGRSLLDEVEGIGPIRKKALLHHFGSARQVATAGLADLAAVAGISHAVAKKIYDHFHGDD